MAGCHSIIPPHPTHRIAYRKRRGQRAAQGLAQPDQTQPDPDLTCLIKSTKDSIILCSLHVKGICWCPCCHPCHALLERILSTSSFVV